MTARRSAGASASEEAPTGSRPAIPAQPTARRASASRSAGAAARSTAARSTGVAASDSAGSAKGGATGKSAAARSSAKHGATAKSSTSRSAAPAKPASGKADAGKAEAGKVAGGKADAGNAEAGKVAAGKAEAGKVEAATTGSAAPTTRPAARGRTARSTSPAAGATTSPGATASSAGKTAHAEAPARAAGWTDAELAEIRADLELELSAMGSGYTRSLAELEEMQSGSAAGSGDDQADAGAATFEREQELSIVANRRDLLDQMQRAVARIDAGTYGFCERCGKPIPKARLQAFPAATLDVDCKAREERR